VFIFVALVSSIRQPTLSIVDDHHNSGSELTFQAGGAAKKAFDPLQPGYSRGTQPGFSVQQLTPQKKTQTRLTPTYAQSLSTASLPLRLSPALPPLMLSSYR